MCIYVPEYIHVYHEHFWVQEPMVIQSVGFPRTVVMDSCEPTYGIWEPNPGPC